MEQPFPLRERLQTMPNHPFLVHLPLALAFVLPLLSFGVWVAVWRDALPTRAWMIVLALQVVLTGTGFVAMESGEEEEERVEEIVPHDAMEEHEEAGERFAKWNVPVLLLTLLPLVVFRSRKNRQLVLMATSCAAMATSALFALNTGQSGGALVYQHQAARAYAPAAAPSTKAPATKHTEHDEHAEHD